MTIVETTNKCVILLIVFILLLIDFNFELSLFRFSCFTNSSSTILSLLIIKNKNQIRDVNYSLEYNNAI